MTTILANTLSKNTANYFYNLPDNVIKIIYSFDTTYHNIYKELMDEFYKKTPYWCVSNDVLDNSYYSYHNPSKYSLEFNKARNIKNYWNNDYILDNIRKNPAYHYMTMNQIAEIFSNKSTNYIVCLFDTDKTAYKRFFRDLNIYKKINFSK